MKYFSLFSGIGGFEKGIQQAREGWECVGHSEINKYAEAIYRYHYKNKNYGDATKINAEIPDFDLLTAGFPCQSFSIAGKRQGFDDTRGTLFFEICRIARIKRPKYLLLENVKGLLNHDGGQTFSVIIESLDELGYDCEWQVLNSKNHGVPQNRERVFIIGYLGEGGGRKVFPLGESNGVSSKENKGEQKSGERICSTIDSSYGAVRNAGETYILKELTKDVSDAQRVYSADGIAKTLKGEGGGQGAKTGLYDIGDTRIRRLTPVECERLQGFPDNWTKYGIMNGKKVEISDTQRYKCLGNAVTTNVVQDIFERL